MEQIKRCYPELELELITMKTTGDIILDRTLDKIGGKGLFVKELEKALHDGVIDISVNSLKDMEIVGDNDLPIVAFSQREDPRDVLVLPIKNPNAEKKYKETANILGIDINGAIPLGCSSARRKVQLFALKNDLQIEPVRGNVITRLNKLDRGEYSALVLAYAGLKRLSLENRISGIFSAQEIIPAAGQGILAVQGRKDDDYSFLKDINNKEATDAAHAEREFVKTLEAGCSSPVAAFAEINGEEMRLSGLYVDEKTGKEAKGILTGKRSEARNLGYNLAVKLLLEVK